MELDNNQVPGTWIPKDPKRILSREFLGELKEHYVTNRVHFAHAEGKEVKR